MWLLLLRKVKSEFLRLILGLCSPKPFVPFFELNFIARYGVHGQLGQLLELQI
jgi:hypothetical protein